MTMNFEKECSISTYSVIPRIVPVGVEKTISIRFMGDGLRYDPTRIKRLGHVRFDDAMEYTVSIIPMELYDYTYVEPEQAYFTTKVRPKNGTISVNYVFEGEQEWSITVISDADARAGKAPLVFRVYSLESDLYELNPYCGDLHVHSIGSDGREDIGVTAANYRKEGYDFMALTDHNTRSSSVKLLDIFADVPCDMKLFHGEEVHPRGELHVVNFGSKYSVNDLYRSDPEKYHAELLAEAGTIKTPKYVNPLEYCYRKWIHNEINKAGGISIVTHPYWICKDVYNMNTATLRYVFESGIYDAFELLGGESVHENNIQSSFWQQTREDGLKIPIVGSSDSHGTDPAVLFGIARTILFAKDTEFKSIVEAIKGGYSTAVEHPRGESNRVYGPYRLVKYVRFLLNYYFPGHDELCVEEGRLMREYALGDAEAADALRALHGRVARYREHTLRGR